MSLVHFDFCAHMRIPQTNGAILAASKNILSCAFGVSGDVYGSSMLGKTVVEYSWYRWCAATMIHLKWFGITRPQNHTGLAYFQLASLPCTIEAKRQKSLLLFSMSGPGNQGSVRKGVWEPLSAILYGYAVHPLKPGQRDSSQESKAVNGRDLEESAASEMIVGLDVGDEVYAFERYVPKGKEVNGIWYRGYVVITSRKAEVNCQSSSPSSTEQQHVYMGIFPASHIHMREQFSDEEGRLQDMASSLSARYDLHAIQRGGGAMSVLLEEDEQTEPSVAARRSHRLGPPPGLGGIKGARPSVSSQRASPSLRSVSPASSQVTLKPSPPRPAIISGDETVSGSGQPIIDEISSALREWHSLMFTYLIRRDYKLFHVVREHIEALHLGRRQLLAQTLSNEETINLRRDCVARLVAGNVIQGLDVIVRHPAWGGLVSVDVEGETDIRSWVSGVRMYAMQSTLAYTETTSSGIISRAPAIHTLPYSSKPLPILASSAFPEYGRPRQRAGISMVAGPTEKTGVRFYHVFLDVRAFVASLCSPGETAELYFSLYNKVDARFLTEDYCAVLNHNGASARDGGLGRLRTLFIDLAQADIEESIYLVCRIVRNGSMKMNTTLSSSGQHTDGRRPSESLSARDPAMSTWSDIASTYNGSPLSPQGWHGNPFEQAQFRRPFGCAVLELSQLSQLFSEKGDASSTREHTMPIFIPSTEAAFSTLHQDIIASKVREFQKSPRAEMIAVSIKVFRGDATTVVKENPSLLQEVPLTSPLGFPDVVFPGDVRNEVYIKLWSGEFFSGIGNKTRKHMSLMPGSAGPFNIQVTVEVRNQSGTVEHVISPGSGEPLITQFRSMVFYRNNSPTYGELVKLLLPDEVPPQYHLFFTFRHRTSKEKGPTSPRTSLEPADKPFAFAYLPLFPDSRAFVQDGSHCLVLYRVDKVDKSPQILPSDYYGAPAILPSGQRPEALVIPPHLQRTAIPMRDSLVIRSYLCSTKYTQNGVLLGLLHWQNLTSHDELLTVLSKFTFVGEVEIVKYLRDIFDSLFAILISQSNSNGELDDLVFNALVAVLGIVQDHRFSNFQPVLDVYIEKHFSCSSASSHILQSMNRLLSDPASAENAQPLRSALKVWHYLFKFIARSRELQKTKEHGVGSRTHADLLETSFKRDVSTHLEDVYKMMASVSPLAIIGTQTIALQNFTSILPDLAKIFTTVELVGVITSFANSITAAKGKIIIWKLIMYLQVVKSFLFDLPQSRPMLVEAIVVWIKPYFGKFDDFSQGDELESARHNARINWLQNIRLCVTIIAIMLDKIQASLIDTSIQGDPKLLNQEQEHVEYLLSLIPRLLDSYIELRSPASWKAIEQVRSPATLATTAPVAFPESYPFSLVANLPSVSKSIHTLDVQGERLSLFNCALAETAVVFFTLVLSSPQKYLLGFLESILEIEGRDNFTNLLFRFFKMANSVLDDDAWPKNWLNVDILAHKVLLKFFDPTATLLIRDFVPGQRTSFEFDATLWRESFQMLLKLLSSDQLIIEDFSPQKRRAVWKLSGDLRGEGADILLRLWEALGWPESSSNNAGHLRYGGYQSSLTTLVGHVVNLCLSKHDLLREYSTQILYSMIVSEYHLSGQFDDIENEVVTKLDSLFMSDSKGEDISRAFFIGHLRRLFDSSTIDDALRNRISHFLASVDLFLELLLSVRALPEGEEYQDDRVIATLRLMNFIRRIGRDEIYIKYVHQLVNMHLQSQNYVEAALTLKLHADLHDWDLHTFVEPMEDLGLPRQTAFTRKETLCLLILDYLGKGKAWESAIDICKELAVQHSEFTFNYSCLSEILTHQAMLLDNIITEARQYPDYFLVAFYGQFPDALRGKQYIYRGFEWEKYSAFCERMLNKHPGARIVRNILESMDDIQAQYLVIIPVEPEPDREAIVFTNPDVPSTVRMYYEHCAINVFSSSTQVARNVTEEEEIWIEKTYYTTEETFPTVLKRSEVIDTASEDISPLENALTEVTQRTKKLVGLERKYNTAIKTGQTMSTNALAMSLNEAVEAPADEGVPHYRNVFFVPDYIERHPEWSEGVQKLREAIDDQARVLCNCLKLHGQICPQEMLGFHHETLERLFQKHFAEEILRLHLESVREPRENVNTLEASSPVPSGPQTLSRSSIPERLRHKQSESSFPDRAYITPPPLHLGRTGPGDLPPLSPLAYNQLGSTIDLTGRNPTPLHRHIAHLARYGMTGVSSGTTDRQHVMGSDEHSLSSFRESSVNVNGGGPGHSGVSITQSQSHGGGGSLKSTLRKFGSLNLGRTS